MLGPDPTLARTSINQWQLQVDQGCRAKAAEVGGAPRAQLTAGL